MSTEVLDELAELEAQQQALAEQRKAKVLAMHKEAAEEVDALEQDASPPDNLTEYEDTAHEVQSHLDSLDRESALNWMARDSEPVQQAAKAAREQLAAAVSACRDVVAKWNEANPDAADKLAAARARLATLDAKRREVDPTYKPYQRKLTGREVAERVYGWVKEAGKMSTLTVGEKLRAAGLTRPGNLSDLLSAKGIKQQGTRNLAVYVYEPHVQQQA